MTPLPPVMEIMVNRSESSHTLPLLPGILSRKLSPPRPPQGHLTDAAAAASLARSGPAPLASATASADVRSPHPPLPQILQTQMPFLLALNSVVLPPLPLSVLNYSLSLRYSVSSSIVSGSRNLSESNAVPAATQAPPSTSLSLANSPATTSPSTTEKLPPILSHKRLALGLELAESAKIALKKDPPSSLPLTAPVNSYKPTPTGLLHASHQSEPVQSHQPHQPQPPKHQPHYDYYQYQLQYYYYPNQAHPHSAPSHSSASGPPPQAPSHSHPHSAQMSPSDAKHQHPQMAYPQIPPGMPPQMAATTSPNMTHGISPMAPVYQGGPPPGYPQPIPLPGYAQWPQVAPSMAPGFPPSVPGQNYPYVPVVNGVPIGMGMPVWYEENQALLHKRRVIKRRTRTGCLTCRKRRIKCDERKPYCFNCERSRKVCLGYQDMSRKRSTSDDDKDEKDSKNP